MSLSFVRQATSKKQQLCSSICRQYNQRSTRKQALLLISKSASNYSLCRYNSTAVAVQDSPSSYPHYVEPIILPNPGLATYKETARVLPSNIAEQYAILKACLTAGDMARAERIMIELFRNRREEMKVFADVNVYNAFLNGFVEAGDKPMTRPLLLWFDNMQSYGLNADVHTFAIIIKGFLRIQSYHTARTLLGEMISKEGFTVEEMLNSQYLSNEDIQLLRKMISASQGSTEVKVVQLLNKLESAMDSMEGKGTETFMKDTAPTTNTTSTTVSMVEENIPEVRPTKAIGVQFLQEQLAALRDSQTAMKMDPQKLQRDLEQQGYEMALQKLLHTKEQHLERGDTLNAYNLTPLKRTMWNWHEQMVPLIKEEIERCDKASAKETERAAYGPFLKLLPPQTLSIVTILELLRLHNSSGIGDGMKTARALLDVGKAVEMEYNAVQLKKATSTRRKFLKGEKSSQLFTSEKAFNVAMQRLHKRKEEKDDLTATNWNPVWPSTIRAKVGSVLTSLLLEAAKIPVPSKDPETGMKIIENIPAFFHTYQYIHGKRLGVIKFSEQLTQMLSREPVKDTLHPRLLPMLVKPYPWVGFNQGGYLSTPSLCMRIKDSNEQLIYLEKASDKGHLNRVLDGLNVLGSTCWKVNKNVFKVVLDVWNTGEALADIPPAFKEHSPLPPKPANYDTDPKAKFDWVNQVKQIQTTEKNNHSLRCDVNYKVETARAFLNLPMYFPHNMDFRGRAYPMPPTLNHLGNDLCRGLLHFDKAKPLGARGWKWLKIHLANLTGFDKHSFTEREQFTMENMDNILDSVDRPLDGKRWWLQAENPWQCLAACFEVAAAYRSGNPEEFNSQLPVHQDGTCNGLQHYAALGGDLAGARAVNLAAGDRPADVYTGVADMVNKQINERAAEGDEFAKILQGNISRKVVKQTVMTNVYGVTFVGARAQLESRLKENPNIPRDKVYALSGYLARAVFSSLGEMFSGAHRIQDWLTNSARRIARSVPLETLQAVGVVPGGEQKNDVEEKKTKRRGNSSKKVTEFSARNPTSNQMSSVIWTTPLGLPIVQPYRRSGKKQVSTLLQTVFIEDPDASRPVNAVKQSTAFPPNFIHSLDATHMLMSAKACNEKEMTFASVHDSYWTHACDVDEMNKVIRDQFIELHSQPIMENLLSEFKERYKDYRVPKSVLIEEEEEKKEKKTASATLFAEDATKLDEALENEKTRKEQEKREAFNAIFGLDDASTGDAEADDNEDEDEEESPKKKRTGRGYAKFKYSWEPLTFPPLPERGEFDINEVKESPYFFH